VAGESVADAPHTRKQKHASLIVIIVPISSGVV
jgi:hypothetical protein